jgi:hypothetical protein
MVAIAYILLQYSLYRQEERLLDVNISRLPTLWNQIDLETAKKVGVK